VVAPVRREPLRPLADAAVERVAIVRLRVGLGDVLVTVPALRALRSARPDVSVSFVSWPEVRPVVFRFPELVDEFLDFPGHPGLPDRPAGSEAAWHRFVAEARSRRFDVAVQLYGARPAANDVTASLGAVVAGGFVSPGSWPADPATHIEYPTSAHEVDRHLLALEHLGVAGGRRHLEFPISPAERRAGDALLRSHALQAGRYAVLHPGATAASRRWPPGRFAAVGDELRRSGLRIVVSGRPSESAATAAVAEAMERDALDLCGATDVGTFAVLLERAAVVVTNDSGPAHLAAAVGAPSVTIFLAGDPARWAPRGRQHRTASAAPACQPCGHQRCPIDFRCATGLAPSAVASLAADAATQR
jgi:ADP-heptose:LPS heptosyltransferase